MCVERVKQYQYLLNPYILVGKTIIFHPFQANSFVFFPNNYTVLFILAAPLSIALKKLTDF